MIDYEQNMVRCAERVSASMRRRHRRVYHSPTPSPSLIVKDLSQEERRQHREAVRQQKRQTKLEKQRRREEKWAQRELEIHCHAFYERTRHLHVFREDIAGHIYVITPAVRQTPGALYPCKIGYSKNPKKRLASLQGAHYDPLIIRFVSPKLWNVQRVEETLHHRFRSYRRIGEWFTLSDTLIEQLEQVMTWETELNRLIGEYHTAYQCNGGVNEQYTDDTHRDYTKLKALLTDYWRLEKECRPVHFPIV